MASFDSLLSSIHSGFSATDEGTNDIKKSIKINAKRQFVPGEDFDTVIAYEGDINSQIVSFWCEGYIDNHELYSCTNHELRWKNLASGTEGTSKLTLQNPGTDKSEFAMMWEVPAEACTQAGTLEISISIYDKNQEGKVVFSWNTTKYSGLTIGGSLETVGFDFPAKDEILFIDKDTKNISSPPGYNNVVCNYGDIGMSEIYFLIDRYLGKKKGLDVYDENTKITVYVMINGFSGSDYIYNATKQLYSVATDTSQKNGMVFITWQIPEIVTAGPAGPSEMQIMLCFENGGKKWYTNTYRGLTVGQNLYNGEVEQPKDWDMFKNYIYEAIESYFVDNEVVIDANE